MKLGGGGCFSTRRTFFFFLSLHMLSEVYSTTYLVVSCGYKVLKLYQWFHELLKISFTSLAYREEGSYVTAD